jgi:hypothetical protein
MLPLDGKLCAQCWLDNCTLSYQFQPRKEKPSGLFVSITPPFHNNLPDKSAGRYFSGDFFTSERYPEVFHAYLKSNWRSIP